MSFWGPNMRRLFETHAPRLVPGYETMSPSKFARQMDGATGVTTPENSDFEDAAAAWLAAIEAGKGTR